MSNENIIGQSINNAMVYCDRGKTYCEKGDLNLAVEYYSKAIQLDPDNAEAYKGRGFAYDKKGNYDDAIANYSRAIYLIDVGEKIIEDGKKVSNFVKKYAGDSFPFYFDPNANLLKKFGFVEENASNFPVPIIVILDADLRVLNIFTGTVDNFPQILWGNF